MEMFEAVRERRWWRPTLIASGVLLAVGGGMHPSAPDELSTRDELATMMDDSAWVPGHALVLASTILLALGLHWARRSQAWPAVVDRVARLAAVAIGLYAIEAFFHMISSVDADRLRDSEFAPVAYVHLGLGVVLYPASGLAIAWLASRLWPVWSMPARVFAAAGIVGGVLHAISVPITLSGIYDESGPVFAAAGVLISLWTIALGLAGLRSATTVDARSRRSDAVPAAG